MRRLNLNWTHWSLAVKLTLLITVLIVGIVMVITVLSLRRERQILEAELQRQVSLTLDSLTPSTVDSLYFLNVDELDDLLDRLTDNQAAFTFGRIYDKNGRILADAFDSTLALNIEPDPLGQQLIQRDEVLFERRAEQLLGGRAVVVGQQRLGAIQVGLSTASLEANLATARNQGLMLALVVTLLGVGVAIFFSRSVTRPVEELARASEGIAAGDMSQRVSVRGGDELARLGEAFNQMVGQLQESLQDLTEQTRFLTASGEVSRQLSELLDPVELSDNVVRQIQQSFSYYHVQIYQLDPAGERLILSAATGSAGAEMIGQRHNIPLSAGRSLVARAARSSQSVLVENVHQAADWLPNPLLPDTQAEAAIPIIARGNTVGVLDVQQDDLGGLTSESVAELRILADQIAVSILNSRRFAELEQALAEARRAQERYIETGWDPAALSRRFRGEARFSRFEEDQLDEAVRARARRQAAQHESLALLPAEGDGSRAEPEAVVAPIRRQDITIGNMQLYPLDADYAWTEDDLQLITAVVDQVAQTAENLRLFEETREQGQREQVIREITEKMQAATNLGELLKTTTDELGRIFAVDHAGLSLGIEAQAPPAPAKNEER